MKGKNDGRAHALCLVRFYFYIFFATSSKFKRFLCFFFFFFGLDVIFFFFFSRHDFFFLINLGDCFYYYYYYFFDCWSLFCFNWASFCNKSILVNLYKLTFFIPSHFHSQLNKKERN